MRCCGDSVLAVVRTILCSSCQMGRGALCIHLQSVIEVHRPIAVLCPACHVSALHPNAVKEKLQIQHQVLTCPACSCSMLHDQVPSVKRCFSTYPFGRVIDAPWKVPGAETSAFFNYNLTPARWRAYIRDVQQAHAEMRMQGRIQLFEPLATAARDPDMPAELAAAIAKVSKSLHALELLAGVLHLILDVQM